MRRKRFANGKEFWEDLGPAVGRRHTPCPSVEVVNFMGAMVSVTDARRELDAHVIPLVVAARHDAQVLGEFDVAA